MSAFPISLVNCSFPSQTTYAILPPWCYVGDSQTHQYISVTDMHCVLQQTPESFAFPTFQGMPTRESEENSSQ